MAVSVNWGTKVIFVPKADTTLVGTDPVSGREVRSYDVNDFRLELKALEDNEQGITYDDTHRHNTEVTLSGVTYARTVEIINGYSVEFEDGPYGINLSGANHNVGDVNVINQVQLRIFNSAGLIVAGSGVTAPDIEAIADAVWDETLADHNTVGSTGEALGDAATGSSLTLADIADAVWDETLADHTTPGSTGESLDDAGTGANVPTTGDIADAVWDEPQADHTTAGSTGESLDDAASGAGLNLANIADAVWDEPIADHLTAGSTGEALDAGGSGGGTCESFTVELAPSQITVSGTGVDFSFLTPDELNRIFVTSIIDDGNINSIIRT